MTVYRSISAAAAIGAVLCLAGMALPAFCQSRSAASSRPAAPNQFVTVAEFVQAKRAAGTRVSVEGYFVSVLKSGKGVASCALVDSTDKVLSAADAAAAARTGARCTVPLGGKGKPRWSVTRKGLLTLAMYTGTRKPDRLVQDTPPKVRVEGTTGRTRGTLSSITRIEYQDENGDWREFR